MNLKEITLLVFDEKTNFEASNTQLQLGPTLYKKVLQFESREEFDKIYLSLPADSNMILVCHVFHAQENEMVANRGFLSFRNSGIESDYEIKPIFVSSGDSGEVMNRLHKDTAESIVVYNYHKLHDNIRSEKIKPFRKKDSTSINTEEVKTQLTAHENEKAIKFAIITGLFDDEFEEVEKLFDWENSISNSTFMEKIGTLKGFANIKVVAAFQHNTGMIDAAILSTYLIEKYKPTYILMPGVCGGNEKIGLGEIVVAKQVFTFQKGKLSEIEIKTKSPSHSTSFKNELEKLMSTYGIEAIPLFENFEIEHDSIIQVDPTIISTINNNKRTILDSINKDLESINFKTNIHFEPIACSTFVVNKTGFFKEQIKKIHRKTAAVEMEGFGVAKAAITANNGSTKFLIFKAVMDNTVEKDDKMKRVAAYISSLFLKHLLKHEILA